MSTNPRILFRSRAGFALFGLAALIIESSANATADESPDLAWFGKTKCSAYQIYHSLEKIAPEEIAKIKSGPVGSRRQKWLLNWLIRSREAVDGGEMIPTYEQSTGGMFNDLDWRTYFQPYTPQIAEDCINEPG